MLPVELISTRVNLENIMNIQYLGAIFFQQKSFLHITPPSD